MVALKRSLFAIITATLVFFLSTVPLYAQTVNIEEDSGPENVVLASNTTVNEDYFSVAETVTIDGTINGDAYLVGSEVNINGIINGDLLALAGTVNVNGKVNGNIRTAAGSININTPVGGNVTTLSGETILAPNATVSGSLATFTGALIVDAPVQKGMTIGAGSATLSNTVGGNITAGVETLDLEDGTIVKGNLNYWSTTPANMSTDTTVIGEFNHYIPDNSNDISKDQILAFFASLAAIFMVISFFSALLIGLLLIKLAPNHMDQVALAATEHTGKSLLYGFITLIVVPIAIIILLLTLIGIPLALIALAAYCIILYVSKIAASYAIGRALLTRTNKKHTRRGWMLLLGLVILSIVEFIPFIGWMISFGALLIGMGSIAIAKENLYNTLKEKNLI